MKTLTVKDKALSPVSFRLPPDILAKLDEIAEQENRSRSSLLVNLIAREIERRSQELNRLAS